MSGNGFRISKKATRRELWTELELARSYWEAVRAWGFWMRLRFLFAPKGTLDTQAEKNLGDFNAR